MKKVEFWESDDGIRFLTREQCEAHEKSKSLYNFIYKNIGNSYCDDAGFSIIEVTDVEKFIKENFTEIAAIMTRQELK